MKQTALYVCLLLPLYTSTPSSAQDWECSDPSNLPQQGMNYCAALDFQKADQALNAAWKLIRPETAKAADGSDPLLDAQRAWIDYRNGQCAAEGLSFEGGSMEPFIVALCRARMTRARTEELLLMERFQ